MIEIADQLLSVEDASGGEIKEKNPEAAGRSVHIENLAAITTTVGGTAKVDDIYFAGTDAVFMVSDTVPLATGASIGISAAAGQVVCNEFSNETWLESYFVCVEAGCELSLEEGKLKVVEITQDQPTEEPTE